LDRSERLFIQDGYQKTSMDMIARECGLSKPTLYHYFKGKYELFTSLYIRLYHGLLEATKTHLSENLDKFQILENIIDEHFALMYAKKDFLSMYFRESHLVIHENIEEHINWHIRSKEEMVGLLSQFLKDVMRSDVKKKFGAEMAARVMFNIFEGMITDVALHDEKDFAAQKKFILQLLQNGVLDGAA